MTLSSHSRRVLRHFRETFGWRESDLGIWHGAKFMLDTCVPALVGLLLGEPQLGFIGALAGSLFSSSDTTDPLAVRWKRLFEITIAMIVCGLLGYVLGSASPLFWVLLIGLVFGAAWLQLASNSSAPSLRWGAIFLISTAGLPNASWNLAYMVLCAALVSAVTIWWGARFYPNAAPFMPPSREIEARPLVERIRFCAIYSIAALAALLIGEARGVTHPMWITTTVLLVILPDARSSLARIVQRSWGTLIGVLAAALTVHFFHSAWTLFVAVVVLSYAIPHAAIRNYWMLTALFAWLVLLLYDFASVTHFNRELIGERFLDVTIGCVIAFVATILAFVPLRQWKWNSLPFNRQSSTR